LLQLTDLPVDIRLEKEDLHLLLHNGLQKLENKPLEVNIPILGEVTIMFYNIDLQSVIPDIGRFLIQQRVAVKIDPASRLVSSISGVLQLSSQIAAGIQQEEVSVDFKVENFQWLDGPHIEESGKHLGIVKKVSSVLFNQFDFIEERISRKLEDALKPEHLAALLQSIPFTFFLQEIKINLSKIKLTVHHFQIGDGYLAVGITAGFEINPGNQTSRETSVEFASRRKDIPVRLKISERMINGVLPSQIDRINQQIKKLPIGVKHMEVKLHLGELRVYLWPDRLLNNPVIFALSIRFNKETREILLDEFGMRSPVNPSIMTRGILKVVRQRMEKPIRQYFPLKTDLLLEQHLPKVQDVEIPGIPLRFRFERSRLQDLQLNEGTIIVVLDTLLYLASMTIAASKPNRKAGEADRHPSAN
jgi:hypothetical protein